MHCNITTPFVILVGIGNGVLEDELRGMASGPLDGNVIQVDNFGSLRNVVNTLSTGLCNSKCYRKCDLSNLTYKNIV